MIDEPVYQTCSRWRGAGSGVYHTDADCHHLRDRNVREIERGVLPGDATACQHCVRLVTEARADSRRAHLSAPDTDIRDPEPLCGHPGTFIAVDEAAATRLTTHGEVCRTCVKQRSRRHHPGKSDPDRGVGTCPLCKESLAGGNLAAHIRTVHGQGAGD
jgi:hypothetical protein